MRALVATQATSIQGVSDRVTAIPTVGRWLGRQVFTASGPYVPAAGAARAIVQMCGGGGGGGAGEAASSISLGGGGASGVTVTFTLGASSSDVGPLSSGSVSIGSGGIAGVPGFQRAGKPGTSTTLQVGGVTYVAGGGGGGVGGTMNGVGTAQGGSPLTGSLSGVPQLAHDGTSGLVIDTSGNGLRGTGGSSPFGYSTQALTINVVPDPPLGFGAGGSGAVVIVSQSAGASGGDGIVVVDEFSG